MIGKRFRGYFEKFPTAQYRIETLPGEFHDYDVIRTWRRVIIPTITRNNPDFFKNVQMTSVMRPDVLSYQLYKNPGYHWTFFMMNDWLNNFYNDWPVDNETLEKEINESFEGYTVHFPNGIPSGFRVGAKVSNPVTEQTTTILDRNFEFECITVKDRINLNASGEIRNGGNNHDILFLGSARAAPAMVVDSEGYKVSSSEFESCFDLPDHLRLIRNEDTIYDKNEERKTLRVIREEYIQQVMRELESTIRGDIRYGTSV